MAIAFVFRRSICNLKSAIFNSYAVACGSPLNRRGLCRSPFNPQSAIRNPQLALAG